ncbi:hypothetical protein [Streptomyces sp. NRRL S-474]|uniref:hypothetical protein n=1 Tax=Streptomyces sp. NRRL S-474 TaxID=1463909 RepID=UPI001F324F00|nr:hypothetical protein [Streptomyces sp. NRRL S-474]
MSPSRRVVGPPFWRELSGGACPGPVAVADVCGAEGVADRDGLGEALGADGDGEADGLRVAVGDGGGAAGAGGVVGALPVGGVAGALLDGVSGTPARVPSGSAVSRDGAS